MGRYSLADYENHMSLDSIMQLQVMNEMMKKQFAAYSVSSIMILGIASVMVLNIFRKTNLKEYMALTSILPIADGYSKVSRIGRFFEMLVYQFDK